jgi:hypothetical protein
LAYLRQGGKKDLKKLKKKVVKGDEEFAFKRDPDSNLGFVLG